jgi:hypothetical protein
MSSPLVPRRCVERLLEVLLASGAQLAAEVVGELPEAVLMHLNQWEDLEEALNGGQVLVVHRLVEPSRHYSPHLNKQKHVGVDERRRYEY